MSVINTNTKALFSQHALKISGREMSKAMEQLSTGKRINTAGDDAAGLAIATRMTQQIRALDQAVRNSGDAIALIQTAEGATNEITDMLQRMRELAIQAINDTNSNEDRSYLDLEFQQLKKEIVRIADMTEWNGFKVLNGSAGEPVGEKPVYKATSNSAFDTVFISPTTFRDIGGASAGEEQTITFTTAGAAAAAGGTITVDGVAVSVLSGDTADQIATKVSNALLASTSYGAQSGRSVSVSTNVVTIRFGATEGDVNTIANPTISAGVATTAAVATTQHAVASTSEAFNANGKFLKSGSLSLTSTNGTVAARFLGNDGVTTTMTGTFSAAAGTITFAATGENAKVISDTLTYTFKNAAGLAMTSAATTTDLTARTISLNVGVEGSMGPLRAGDLIINGVSIGDSYVSDDTRSPPNNASGSAIAIAAAINREMDVTGVHAVVNANEMTGTAMAATSAVSGYAVINGYTSPLIETTLNNTRESREKVVNAINFISHLTGVTAVDTGADREGIKLVAADGRNIEVTFSGLSVSDATFAERTGLKTGVQVGTYSLEARVEDPIVIDYEATFDITRARLSKGDYSENQSELVTDLRSVVSAAAGIKPLLQGDLVINGVAIRATTDADDKVSSKIAASSSRAASAVAIAAAINDSTDEAGVLATAYPATIEGLLTARTAGQTGLKSLFVNGITVSVDFSEGTTAGERADEVVEKINLTTGQHGVRATKNDVGGVVLETIDGRNLSVWFDSTSIKAADFGLATTSVSTAASGVSAIAGGTAASTTASTVYGRVKLTSLPPQNPELPPGTSSRASVPVSQPIVIEAGVNGFASTGNFTALGFTEMTFGGEVDEAVTKMTPPRTGRLAFQVGASAGQLITIDLADFGKGGPVTREITGDVDNATQTNHISSSDAASAVLANLDVVMDRVNATRASMGAVMNRLTYAMDNLTNASTNQSASRSQIQDADYAKASTDLARSQIMQQAGTAILAQANMSQQTVLQLLQG